MASVPFSGYLKVFAHAGKIVANRPISIHDNLDGCDSRGHTLPLSLRSKDLHYFTALEGEGVNLASQTDEEWGTGWWPR
jgi:hypothetical protein